MPVGFMRRRAPGRSRGGLDRTPPAIALGNSRNRCCPSGCRCAGRIVAHTRSWEGPIAFVTRIPSISAHIGAVPIPPLSEIRHARDADHRRALNEVAATAGEAVPIAAGGASFAGAKFQYRPPAENCRAVADDVWRERVAQALTQGRGPSRSRPLFGSLHSAIRERLVRPNSGTSSGLTNRRHLQIRYVGADRSRMKTLPSSFGWGDWISTWPGGRG